MGVIVDKSGKAVAHFEGEGIGMSPVPAAPTTFVKVKPEFKSDVTWHKPEDEGAFEILYQAKYSHRELLMDTTVTMRIGNAGYVDLSNFHSEEYHEKIVRFAVIE